MAGNDRVEFEVAQAGQQIRFGRYAGDGRQAKAWMALPGCGKQTVGNPVAGLCPPGVDQGNQGQWDQLFAVACVP